MLGDEFRDGVDASASPGVLLASALLSSLIIPTLVTALHVRAVQGLAEGREPSVGRVLREALRLAPAVLPVVALYSIGIFFGFLALIVPGIYFAVKWFFHAQHVVVDGERGADALRASGRLVEGSWLRVLGTVFLLSLAAGVIGYVVGGLLGLVVHLVTEGGAWYVLVQTIGQTIALSISALGGTLLFFDLRREKGIVDDPMRGFLPPTGLEG